MINSEQIRAARALLDWSTKDLAGQCGMTVNGLNKIERGYVSSHRETFEKLQAVFEAAGIEFLPGSGVRKKDRIVTTHEGENSLKALVEDIYNTLKDKGGEMLIAHLSEGDAVKSLGSDYLEELIRKRKAANITHRLLVRGSDPKLIPPFDTYHVLPDEFFSSNPLYVYGPKLALRSRQPEKVIIIDDERFADCVRKLFDFVWIHTKPPYEKVK